MIRLSFAREGARPLHVLCLGAHSDDIEIGCGATMLRLARDHSPLDVRWVVFTADGAREAEARAGASRFLDNVSTSKVEIHHFRNGYFPDEWARIKDVFESLKRERDPDLIFTHWRGDAHQDHRVLAELAWNTWRNHLILEYEIPKYDGDLGRPSLFVPIDDQTADRKVKHLMATFGSQLERPWFSPSTFLGLMRMRSVEAQCPETYAEAFHCRKCVIL